MIGQSLSNTNETCYSVPIAKICNLNKAQLTFSFSDDWILVPKLLQWFPLWFEGHTFLAVVLFLSCSVDLILRSLNSHIFVMLVCVCVQVSNYLTLFRHCTFVLANMRKKKREIGVLIGVQPLVTILTRICIQHLCIYAELWNPFHLLILELVHA